MSKTVAIYVRVSTLDQSLESQTRALLEWGARNNISNYEITRITGFQELKKVVHLSTG